MVATEYNQVTNFLRYSSHRNMTMQERMAIENYLLKVYAPETSYWIKNPSFFAYIGVNEKLLINLELFKLKTNLMEYVKKENAIEVSVKSLISSSMGEYYFGRICEELLDMRKAANENSLSESAQDRRDRMIKLVDAYNIHVQEKIKIADLIPDDLKNVFMISK
jgi:hypothetical protein